jgi:hypothetical protein
MATDRRLLVSARRNADRCVLAGRQIAERRLGARPRRRPLSRPRLGRRSPPLHLQGADPSCYGEGDRSDQQHGIDTDGVQPKTVDDGTGRLAEEKEHGMSSGRRAARRWRQFRDVDLNATVQQVESEAHDDKICKLDRLGHAQRNNDETESHRHAAGRHEPALTDIRQQLGDHESVDDAADAKSGDHHACDRSAFHAVGAKQSRR